MSDSTMPDRITAWPWEVNPNMGQWETVQSVVGEGQPYLAMHGETLTEVRACLGDCIAMIQHAIGPGRDVFIEPDVKRRLSDARAALAKMGG